MKAHLTTLICLCTALSAQAQITPIGSQDMLLGEASRTVDAGWKSNTWRDYKPGEFKYSRQANGIHTSIGGDRSLYVDTRSFYFSITPDLEKATLKIDREGKPLVPGLTWKSELVYDGLPASWCSDTKTKLESNFEVGASEPYTVKIDGKEVSVNVMPIVEKGFWNRCYSGKRVVRTLYSAELDAVVSIEFMTYDPRGKVHDASFRYNLTEVKRQL
jgi:hypothetical protein